MRSLITLSFLAFTIFLFTETSSAEGRYPIVGSWQSGGNVTFTFNQDGTFQGVAIIYPQMNNGVGGQAVWGGHYTLTSSGNSWSSVVEYYQFCRIIGGCASCPQKASDVRGSDGCAHARSAGVTVNTQLNQTFYPNGPNQFADSRGQTWQRAGTFTNMAPNAPAQLPGVIGPVPGAKCYSAGETFCNFSHWTLYCDGNQWSTTAQKCGE